MPKKSQPLRWTIDRASNEFSIDNKTLTKKLRASEAEPGQDGCYSTAQIVAAIYDDAASERTRLYREQADRLSLENAKTRVETINTQEVFRAYEGIFSAVRQSVLASNLTDIEKSELLSNLRHDVTEAKPAE